MGTSSQEFHFTGLLVVIAIAIVYVARNRLQLFLRPSRGREFRFALVLVLLVPPGIATCYLAADLYGYYLSSSRPDVGSSLISQADGRDRSNEELNDISLAEEADLAHTDFSNAQFEGVDLDRAILDESVLRGAVFKNVNFSAASMCGVDL